MPEIKKNPEMKAVPEEKPEREFTFVRKNHGREERYKVKESDLSQDQIKSMLQGIYNHFKELPFVAQDMFMDRVMELAELEQAKMKVLGVNQERDSRIVGLNGVPLTFNKGEA